MTEKRPKLGTKYKRIVRSYDGLQCSVDGCNSRPMARGLCQKHYERVTRWGTTEPREKPIRLCSIEGCNQVHAAHGLCSEHWEKKRRHGNPLAVTQYESTNGICKVPKCSSDKFARGMCQPHYEFFMKYHVDFSVAPKCYICGRIFEWWDTKTINFDHVVPKSKGGSNSLKNLRVACRRCNHSKNNMILDELFSWCKLILSREDEIRKLASK